MPARLSLSVAALLVVAPLALRAEPAPGDAPPALNNVIWAGAGTTFDGLKGKSAIVLTYVTWCPKCNAWSGDMAKQIKAAIKDKPVVVLAISTDTPPAEAVQYMAERDFTGPNILHGFDPTLAKRFGFDNEFFNFALIGPDGKLAKSGNAGSYYTNNTPRKYVVANLPEAKDLGEFRFLTAEMSQQLKALLFPLELGVVPTAADLNKLKRQLKGKDKETFETRFDEYLDEQLDALKAQAEGEVPDKLAALATAGLLTKSFAATKQGKEAKEVVAELKKDKTLKQEESARKLYDECVRKAGSDADKLANLLANVVKRYPESYYAKQAEQAIAAAKEERDESGGEAKTVE